MPRHVHRRRGAASAALVAVAMLSACTSDSGDTAAPQPTPAVAQSAATGAASSVVAAAVAARSNVTATGVAAREKTFTGAALDSANAFAKTLPARTAAEKAGFELATTGVKVLGVSRAGDSPRQMLVQTTLVKSEAAVLVLLASPDATADFKVAAITPMLKGSTLEALDPITMGSAAVGTGDGLAAKPADVLTAFAASVKFPSPTTTKLLAADPISDQLRASAAAQSKAISAQGSFSQMHDPKGVVGGLRLKGGSGAVVFADLVRNDSIALRQAAKLTPAKDVTLLSGLKLITTEAKLTTNETVAMVIPATGAARIVGYSDQLVNATGR
ncbi:hypothetical protein BA895_10010 [Humibacillus sp. DSM 29435]|uniref:hypothetical protein n=1 Tax=Humibacillus sp. DSM 29435 TaxID=1869167 RepID=UPI000871BAFB|nr:hypothetical protein [Humibacillus sp. DSM 29435]OFE14668.1 hypothetical protein BA895_10010 [Humibacillus sp. DSM 29435]